MSESTSPSLGESAISVSALHLYVRNPNSNFDIIVNHILFRRIRGTVPRCEDFNEQHGFTLIKTILYYPKVSPPQSLYCPQILV